MQRLVRRLGMPAIVTAYLALLCGLAASLILAVGYHDQLTGLKHTILTRCEQRSAYDDRSDAFKRAVEGYYTNLLGNIRHNSANTAFYRQLTAQVRLVIVRAHDAQGHPVNCAVFR